MGKRKATTTPYDLFVKTSWEKSDKSVDEKEFSKTCKVKWREMTKAQKEAFSQKVSSNDTAKEHGGKKTKKAASAKEKDPQKPKKPRSAYIYFCNEFREDVKKTNPALSTTDIVKELSLKWNALSVEEKKKFNDMAAEDKKRYQQEMKNKENVNPEN